MKSSLPADQHLSHDPFDALPGLRTDTRPQQRDSVESAATLLDEGWPKFDPYYRNVYLRGGFAKSGVPATHDVVEAKIGKDLDGNPVFGTKYKDRAKEMNWRGESFPPLERASREATLGLVRAFRTAGGGSDLNKEATRAMMGQRVLGTEWLRDYGPRFDEEFERCWRKAGIPVRQFDRRETKPGKSVVSHPSDYVPVMAEIERCDGAGEPTWLRALYAAEVITGMRWKWRIELAVAELVRQGRVQKVDQGLGLRTLLVAVAEALCVDEPDEFTDDDLTGFFGLDLVLFEDENSRCQEQLHGDVSMAQSLPMRFPSSPMGVIGHPPKTGGNSITAPSNLTCNMQLLLTTARAPEQDLDPMNFGTDWLHDERDQLAAKREQERRAGEYQRRRPGSTSPEPHNEPLDDVGLDLDELFRLEDAWQEQHRAARSHGDNSIEACRHLR